MKVGGLPHNRTFPKHGRPQRSPRTPEPFAGCGFATARWHSPRAHWALAKEKRTLRVSSPKRRLQETSSPATRASKTALTASGWTALQRCKLWETSLEQTRVAGCHSPTVMVSASLPPWYVSGVPNHCALPTWDAVGVHESRRFMLPFGNSKSGAAKIVCLIGLRTGMAHTSDAMPPPSKANVVRNNTIAHNLGVGVDLQTPSAQARIISNAIYNNGALGIKVGSPPVLRHTCLWLGLSGLHPRACMCARGIVDNARLGAAPY